MAIEHVAGGSFPHSVFCMVDFLLLALKTMHLSHEKLTSLKNATLVDDSVHRLLHDMIVVLVIMIVLVKMLIIMIMMIAKLIVMMLMMTVMMLMSGVRIMMRKGFGTG